MRVNRNKSYLSLPVAAFVLIAASGTAFAEESTSMPPLTANIRETTCDMKLVGGLGSDTKQNITVFILAVLTSLSRLLMGKRVKPQRHLNW